MMLTADEFDERSVCALGRATGSGGFERGYVMGRGGSCELNNDRAATPEDLELLGRMPGQAVVARDENLRLFWCNDAFARLCPVRDGGMIGSGLHDLMPPAAAEERAELHRRTMKTGRGSMHIQFGADRRMLCVVLPLDESAFGHGGIVATLKDAPVATTLELGDELPVLVTPCFSKLGVLSSRELEVFHLVARGLTTNDIAEALFRAPKTIDKHVAAIHRKLNTNSRAQLVRYAVERGVHRFTTEQWSMIVEGAKSVRTKRLDNGSPG